ncbi:MAG TPA: phytoene desaturase family protein [Candidatus Limnocylindria bacterium]
MSPGRVVVIGAGVAGITAAAHLARSGHEVIVLDKNGRPGGRCGRLERGGHRFDTGPTLMVMPRLYASEFGALGASLAERLLLRRVDPTYRLVFDDGRQLLLTADEERMRGQVEAMEPGSFRGLQRYLDEGRRHYDVVVDNLVQRDFRRARDFFNLRTLGPMIRTKPLVNHYRHMGRFFETPRLKSAFTFQDLYTGLSPFAAPATLSMLPYSELTDGVWYPMGGMHSVVEALVVMAEEAGVEFRLGTAAARIDTAGRQVRAVFAEDGTYQRADVVLANADLPYVYQQLLPPDRAAAGLARKAYSCSAISFLWALDKRYDLNPHTLFIADDYRENFRQIMRDHDLPTNPSVYLHAPAAVDEGMAPAGEDSLTAIVPVGHLTGDGAQDWDQMRDRARGHVLRRLRTIGITDLDEHVKSEDVLTPLSWAQAHNLVKGATHGLAHTLTQMAWFRPANRHRRYGNLYFAGASTHPGTGIPIAMVSGRLAAQRIASEQR